MIADAGSHSTLDRGHLPMLIAVLINGAVAIWIMATWHVASPLVPLIGSLLPLLARSRRGALQLRSAACAIMLGFAWLGMASVGMFFLPGALAMGLAVGRT